MIAGCGAAPRPNARSATWNDLNGGAAGRVPARHAGHTAQRRSLARLVDLMRAKWSTRSAPCARRPLPALPSRHGLRHGASATVFSLVNGVLAGRCLRDASDCLGRQHRPMDGDNGVGD